jgi:DNA end-binding protein Ku
MASTIRSMNLVCEEFVVPVALRGASEKRDVALGRAVKDADGVYRRVRQLQVAEPDEGAESLTLDPLRRDRKGKVQGIQYEGDPVPGVWDGDDFVEIANSDVEEIIRMTEVDELVIQDFIPLDEVPWERAMASYFLAPPPDTGVTALRYLVMFREAMERKGVAGVGKLMPKSRQKLAIVYPKHGGLMVTVLAYADTFQQVHEGAASMDGVTTNEAVVDLLTKLIDAKHAPVTVLDEYRDDLNDLRADLIERVKLGQPIVHDEEGPFVPTIVGEDALMEKLKASVAALKKPARKKATTKSAAAKKPAAKSGGSSRRRATKV